MRFELTALKDFRNLGQASVDWGPGLNLILGPNGAGKTNLLESLNVLSGWGPFAGHARGVVSWGAERALLRARTAGEAEHEVGVLLSSRMTLRLDGSRVSCTDLRVVLPSVAFLPTGVDLIDGPPSLRRLFVDKLCALCHPPYARRLAEFRQVSRHRSALLRQGKSTRGTTLPFAQLGGWIMEARRRSVSLLSELKGDDLPCDFSDNFSIAMRPRFEGSGAEWLLSALEETAKREAFALRPLVGPGRDDLEILTAGGRPASEALSRGQKRRLVLALILRAGRLIERRLRRRPVLLFDDLGAELDPENRQRAGELLAGTGWQVFVTGAEDPFPDLGKAIFSLPLS